MVGERMTDDNLEQDRRLRRLHDKSWTCSNCGELHHGLMDLGCDAPAFWPASPNVRLNAEARGARPRQSVIINPENVAAEA
jgi:hypothetical protein